MTNKRGRTVILFVATLSIVMFLSAKNRPISMLFAQTIPPTITPLPIDESVGWYELGKDSAEKGGVSDNPLISYWHDLAVGGDGLPVLVWGQYINQGQDNVIYLKEYGEPLWQEIAGSATGYGLSKPYVNASYPTVVLDEQDRPIVAWAQYIPGRKAIYMRRFDGENWVSIGNDSDSGEGVGTATIDKPALVYDGANIYIAYRTMQDESTIIRVKKYDGNEWSQVGLDINSGQDAFIPSLALTSTGKPVVAWSANDTAGRKQVFAKMFDGEEWRDIPDSVNSGGVSNTSTTSYLQGDGLNGDGSDVLYVAWLEVFSEYQRFIYVKKYAGNDWYEVSPNSASGLGITGGIPSCYAPILRSGRDDSLYVAFKECSVQYSNGDGPIRVLKLGDSEWIQMGKPLFPGYDTGEYQLVLDPEGYPIVSLDMSTGESTTNGSNHQVYVKRLHPLDIVAPEIALTINKATQDNLEAAYTTSVDISLSISATNDISGMSAYRIGESDQSLGSWIDLWDRHTYSYDYPFKLTNTDGLKTVYIQGKDKAGNLSLIYLDTVILDKTQGQENGISVNQGDLWTNSTAVSLTIPAQSGTAEMQVSNDGGFSGAAWESYSLYKDWQITSLGNNILPRTVYVRFRSTSGITSGTFQDDIILDITAPQSEVTLLALEGSRDSSTSLKAQWVGDDNLSGIKWYDVQVSVNGGVWQEWLTQIQKQSATYDTQPGDTYSFRTRAQDNAGNWEEYPEKGKSITIPSTGSSWLYLPSIAR